MLTQAACKQSTMKRGSHHTSDSLTAALEECERQRQELNEKKETILQLTADLEKHLEANNRLQGELDHTRSTLEYAERQFISLEQGLQTNQTKASAVAVLAEARLAYDKIVREDPQAVKRANMRQALEKLEQSDQLLPTGRYAASVYFAKRAIRLIEEHEAEQQRVRIISVDKANLRKGPGLKYSVVAKITLGTVLVEVENRSPWYKIETRAGLSGWIHESVTIVR
jgi:hypothetical protein